MTENITNAIRSLNGLSNTEKLLPPKRHEAVLEKIESFSKPAPAELIHLWDLCDGGSVQGFNLLGIDEAFQYGSDLCAIQNWQNGDFDCVLLGGGLEFGSVWFTNHQSDARWKVADSLAEWIAAVIAEIRLRDTVFHPKDYKRLASPGDGVYSGAVQGLSHVNCELTRWFKQVS